MSELMKFGGNNENMNFLDLQSVINGAIAKQNEQLYKMVTEIKDNLAKQEEKIEIMETENQNIRKLQLKEHRVKEHRYGFVGLKDLGQIFTVSIGSKTMGNLLRLVGLAKRKQTKTEPLRSAIINDYAKSFMYGDFPSYQWNPSKCIEKIERWLDKEELIDNFYAIEDEKELMDYINELYEKYDA